MEGVEGSAEVWTARPRRCLGPVFGAEFLNFEELDVGDGLGGMPVNG